MKLGSAALACLPWGQASCAPAPSTRAARPHTVVLVLLESVRADHVGAYGYARPTTPRIDALAANGVLFERAYAGSSSGPQSLSALWTGRLPTSGGSIGLAEATPHEALLTLPRLFLRAGFRTGLVSSHAGLRARAFTRGFDEIEVDSAPGRWKGELVTRKALDMVDQAREEPLFLVVDYADAGEPHLPPEEFRRRIEVPLAEVPLTLSELRAAAGELPAGLGETPGFQDLVARYDAELACVDRCVGELVDGLAERGLLEDTLLVVTASHGTELLEHGYVGHGWTLHEEVLRVPLVLHAPRWLASGRVSSPVSLVDVLPSLRQAFGLESRGLELDGQPFLAPGTPGLIARTMRDTVVAELVIPELCVQRASLGEGRKLVEIVQDAPPEEREELLAGYQALLARVQAGELPRTDQWREPVARVLYDLARDPRETRDASEALPDELATLAGVLARYREACRRSGLEARTPVAAAEPPEAGELGELQQIGYL